MKNLIIFFLLTISANCFSQDVSTWQIVKTYTIPGIIITYTKANKQVIRPASAIYSDVQRGVDSVWWEEGSGMPIEHLGKENDRVLVNILIVGGADFDRTKWYQFIRKSQLY